MPPRRVGDSLLKEEVLRTGFSGINSILRRLSHTSITGMWRHCKTGNSDRLFEKCRLIDMNCPTNQLQAQAQRNDQQ